MLSSEFSAYQIDIFYSEMILNQFSFTAMHEQSY